MSLPDERALEVVRAADSLRKAMLRGQVRLTPEERDLCMSLHTVRTRIIDLLCPEVRARERREGGTRR